MAVTCAHCGTVNPDGNTICQSCGMPLVAAPSDAAATAGSDPSQPADMPGVALPVLDEPIAVPAGGTAAVSPAPSTFLPPGYVPGMSPYLPAPAPGAAPLHRTGGLSVVAIVGVISIVFGGAGAVVAALRTGGTTSPPAASAPANVPPSTTGASTPPSSITASSGSIATTPFAKVFVPSGFSVTDQGADYIQLTPDGNGNEAVVFQGEPLSEPTTNAQLDQELLASDQQNGDPSARFCTTKAPTKSQLTGLGGPITADVISVCENYTPTGGAAFTAVDGFVYAVARTSSGPLEAIWVNIFAPQGDYQTFSNSLPTALFTQTTFTDAGPPG